MKVFDAEPHVWMVVNVMEGRLWLALSRFHVLDLLSRGCCWTHSCVLLEYDNFLLLIFFCIYRPKVWIQNRSFVRRKVKRESKLFRWTKILDKYVFIWLCMMVEVGCVYLHELYAGEVRGISVWKCTKCAHFYAHITENM